MNEVVDILIDKVKKSNEKKNKFELVVEFMCGDADSYPVDSRLYKEDEREDLIRDYNFLTRCMSAFPNGMGGNDGFWDVEGWNDAWEDFFPRDNPDCDGHADVEGIDVFYFDSEGIKYRTELIYKGEK